MIALLMLYPGLSAVKLVGTDLVQAVPLVLAAAISNIALHGLDFSLTIPLILGSVPGTILGSKIAPRVPQSFIRRGIVVVLTMSGVALLDKAGWAPLGAGEDETHPMLIAGIGLAMLFLVPLVWGLLRKAQGLPMFGAPTVAELDDDPRYVGSRAWHAAGDGSPSGPTPVPTPSADSPAPPDPDTMSAAVPTRGLPEKWQSQPLLTPTTS